MGLWEVISLGVALGADSFSVSVGIGMNRVSWSRIVKLSLLFSLLQGLLLVFGTRLAALLDWLLHFLTANNSLYREWLHIGADQFYDGVHQVFSVLGASVLAGLGINMIRTYYQDSAEAPVFYTGRLGLLLLALSVSIDALSAGVGLGMIHMADLSLFTGVITLIIWGMAFIGLSMGGSIGAVIGRRAELVGGALLLLLAAHLFSELLR